MLRVRRHDFSRLDGAVRTDAGYLEAPANLTKTGVFTYARSDGGTQLEYRPAEEVFAPAALASFDLAPLTRGHPAGGRVDATNARQYQVGLVAAPRKADDGVHVAARVRVTDAETIRAIEAGERELSCGYDCGLEPVPGGVYRTADGADVRCDFVQRKIVGNHVATTPRGRAGPTASIRLDADGHSLTTETDHMDIAELTKRMDAQAAELAALKAEAAAAAKTRTDAAEAATAATASLKAENAALKARLDQADAARAAEAKVRADTDHEQLVVRVAPVLGKPVEELRKLDSVAVKKLVIAQEAPGLKLDSDDAASVNAAFATLLATRHDSKGAIALLALGANSGAHNDATATRLDAARTARIKASQDAWKPPAGA